ncbi:hypothetical protein M758_1G132500 [Ceratodon purpureus]|uniref:Rubredoxin-like domain-containing protein n=1 Tax=Ceratodon purpureus TaxID=3225 RepID=A0A8T0J864_CERPU|nr:hypothetical protein KC19_1G137700 [Ceratodon purpureus]KAG0629818.1 hypothetical protein M758_1G132500 [Ceratodon purpureus]
MVARHRQGNTATPPSQAKATQRRVICSSSLVAMACSAAASMAALPVPKSICGLGRTFGARLSGAPALVTLKPASQRRRLGAVVSQDNVEQKLSEQQQKEVVQEALQDTLLNVEEPQKPLSSREGLEERFAVINTGAYECRSCGHVYEEQKGDSTYPVAAGTMFRDLPGDWLCPTCGAAKTYYQTKSVEVAGFAQNQQYGLGGNTLTGGQKSLLIYGSLLAFFALFLSGYFLQ